MKKALFFWVPTSLLLLFMVGSAVMYVVATPMAAQAFQDLGYPIYTMWFNATAKFLGGIAIAFPQFPRWVKEFAYAGYLYIILLAAQAVYMKMGTSNFAFMFVFIGIWVWAYWAFRKTAK